MIDRAELVSAVLASRADRAPDFDEKLLEAIVDAELDAAGDADQALLVIGKAMDEAMARGVGAEQDPVDPDVDAAAGAS